jgi:tricorn protease
MFKSFMLAGAALVSFSAPGFVRAADAPQIFQSPTISADKIAFGYAGDLWIVARTGGIATRLTTGVGIESAPIFSPDGSQIAFTGEYDGNTDVFVVSASGGVPTRLTYHPGADAAVGWTPDGKSIVFRSSRDAASRYTQLYTVAVTGGPAHRLPLPMAYAGQVSGDGSQIAYSPLPPAFGFNFANYVSWGNYRGGRAGTIMLTTLPALDSRQIPHEDASDFAPVFLGGQVYFLSGRAGHIGVFRFDPANGTVSEVYHNTGADIRSLATDGHTLVFDRLGEIFTLTPGGTPQRVAIEAIGDMPDVRPRIAKVGDEVVTVMPSSTGLRAVVEAHGEILTVPVKKGAIRNITNTPGVMERDPAWSPDGQSIAYFSDEDGLYALHVAAQATEAVDAKALRKYPIAPEAAYYFKPLWSPDSKKIAFYDNRLNIYLVDLASGRVTTVNEPDVHGGFSAETHAMAWSPDSQWLVYPHGTANHQHILMLYSLANGSRTALTDQMADAQDPAFDRNGKYLYFLASNNAGATMTGLDMASDLYTVTRSIYALSLGSATPSPVAPESDEEKTVAQTRTKARDAADATPAGQAAEATQKARQDPKAAPPPALATPTRIDLAGLSPSAIAQRIVPLPLPPRGYAGLQTGKAGTLYFLEREADRFRAQPTATLNRWVLADRKKEELAQNVTSFDLTADGEKMLIASLPADAQAGPGGDLPQPKYAIVSATTKAKPGADADERGEINLAALTVRTDPKAEWAQMYHEVWRIQRAYFYDPGFHGLDITAAEKAFAPYVDGLQSRADLNFVFQQMLTGMSVGHLRGTGGAIPSAEKVPGGLLGADYALRNNRYCFSRIYAGSAWSPEIKAPLGQPALGVKVGDCILAINGEPLTAATDIQKPLEGTAGHPVVLRIGTAEGGAPHDAVVVPTASEADLRNLAWIEDNRRTVDRLSGGKLAYVYLPDTGEGGFTAFNRTYFAQTDKQGAIIDERFNGGGQVADYVIEVLGRKIETYWSPRYGQPEHAPGAAIYGPKVMIANEVSGSGGDALPWLFKQAKLGPLVGKRTWGGLVGIGGIPVLMDGGHVTSPSVAFFSPQGQWDVENHGVAPDYAVEQDPKAVAAGHDPQLEAAVALAMKQLADQPATATPRPAYPRYP